MKLRWINVGLVSLRFRQENSKIFNTQRRLYSTNLTNLRSKALIQFGKIDLDQPYEQLLMALEAQSEDGKRRIGHFVAINRAWAPVSGSLFSHRLIEYSVFERGTHQSDSLEVIRYTPRSVSDALKPADLRNLHAAMIVLEKQRKLYRIQCPNTPADVSTVLVYHRLFQALVGQGEQYTEAEFLDIVDDYLIGLRSRPNGCAFANIKQYWLVVNTLFEDLNCLSLMLPNCISDKAGCDREHH